MNLATTSMEQIQVPFLTPSVSAIQRVVTNTKDLTSKFRKLATRASDLAISIRSILQGELSATRDEDKAQLHSVAEGCVKIFETCMKYTNLPSVKKIMQETKYNGIYDELTQEFEDAYRIFTRLESNLKNDALLGRIEKMLQIRDSEAREAESALFQMISDTRELPQYAPSGSERTEEAAADLLMRDLKRTLPTHTPKLDVKNRSDYREFDFASFHNRISEGSSHSEPILDWTRFVERGDLVGMGSFTDVYKGKWVNLPDIPDQPPAIAIKVMRGQMLLSEEEKESRLRSLSRELTIWQELTHPNILPLVGALNLYDHQLSLISAWMEHGSVKDYLKRNPEADRRSLVHDTALGVQYLHEYNPEIIHGDIKADNILVDHRGVAAVADFGLSRVIAEDNNLWKTTATSAGGTVRWQAPELMTGEQPTATTFSDVYAYAMTSFEIMTGAIPFNELRYDAAVIKAVTIDHRRPDRPPLSPVTDDLWELWTSCWVKESTHRPSMANVVRILELPRA